MIPSACYKKERMCNDSGAPNNTDKKSKPNNSSKEIKGKVKPSEKMHNVSLKRNHLKKAKNASHHDHGIKTDEVLITLVYRDKTTNEIFKKHFIM